MVEPFKKLSLRLKENEVGVVKSPFGWHVIKRVPPPPPRPARRRPTSSSASRSTQKAKVKHILLGWTEAHTEDPRGDEARRAPTSRSSSRPPSPSSRRATKIEPLMAELSEDPGSAKSAESYDVTPDAGLVEPFKNLSLRLKVGEVGVVKTQFGIHIIQRVE